MDSEDITFYNPGEDFIYNSRAFVPTMNKDMDIFYWDSALVEWMFSIFWPTQ
jgi:hypothetical protein